MNSYLNLAFIDFETTGFSPRKGDRIVEAAVITTDWNGNILGQFETLVNPMREVTGTEIHQLTAEMLGQAPRFSEIADDLLFHLKDKIIIGHNLSFDLKFLEAELERHFKRQFLFQGMCTLHLSKYLFPTLPVRRLEALCEFLDVELGNVHCAFADCQATVSLFSRMLSLANSQPDFVWDRFMAEPCCLDFDPYPKGIFINRNQALEKSNFKKSQLKDFIKRLPSDPTKEVSELQYLNLLDEVLADRLLTDAELESLKEMILLQGFARYQVKTIHEDYLRNLCRIYWIDHDLSQAEYMDLKVVSEMLGIEVQLLDEIIHEEEIKTKAEQLSDNPERGFGTLTDKTICFTGSLNATLNGAPIDRSFAQKIAIQHGMVIKSGVSKGLDYLVTADPNSLSGKSLKARDYGVKIIAEPVFWSWVNFKVD
jgi:DNA polymerase III subunit epsilon